MCRLPVLPDIQCYWVVIIRLPAMLHKVLTDCSSAKHCITVQLHRLEEHRLEVSYGNSSLQDQLLFVILAGL